MYRWHSDSEPLRHASRTKLNQNKGSGEDKIGNGEIEIGPLN
jgi:hypothetical protein